jgi:hypothetical protein
MSKSNKNAVAEVAPVEQTNTNSNQAADDMAHAKAVLTANNGVKSPAIRQLAKEWGPKSTGRIAKALGIKYQHARNVLITPVKGAANEGAKTE